MTHGLDAATVVVLVSFFLYLPLGAWILTLKPRRLQTKLLGLFALFLGSTTIFGVLFVFHVGQPLLREVVSFPFQLLTSGAALALAWAVPDPLEDRRLLGIALAVGLSFPLLEQPLGLGLVGNVGALPSGAAAWLDQISVHVGEGLLFSALVLLALRARPDRGVGRRVATQLGILSVAFGVWLGFRGGTRLALSAQALALSQSLGAVQEVLEVLPWLAVAGLWGWNMVRAGEETVRIHRATMLGILGLLLAGSIVQVSVPSPYVTIAWSIAGVLGVGLLAYGVLRHDLVGLDAKVEWTVSKTTVAGVFVAVFFIVSEGAQFLFAGFANNELLGIIAAGALLFALSPIQRLADRVAEEVVPDGGAGRTDAEEMYRREVEMALADGEITAAEERRLAERAEALGISHTRELEIREAAGSAEGEVEQ